MTATYQVAPPESFNFSRPTEWTKWIRRFERFRMSAGLQEKSEEAQVNMLIYTMGAEADDIFQSFGLSEVNNKNYETVKSKFDSHFIKRRNIIYEQAKFNQCKQEEGENVDVLIIALYSLAKHCEYGNLREKMIRDRIVVGIRDATLSFKLQLEDKLILEKAITQVREAETIKKQQPLLRGERQEKTEATVPVSSIQKKASKQLRAWKGSGGCNQLASRPNNRFVCSRCGKSPPHDRQHCPARDTTCHKCAKRGHFKAMCRSPRKVGEVHQDSSSEIDYDNVFLRAVGTVGEKPRSVTLQLNSEPVEFQIDTGAEVSVISDQLHKKISSPSLTPVPQTLRGPGNNVLPVKGWFSGKLKKENQETEQEIYVAESLHTPLLG